MTLLRTLIAGPPLVPAGVLLKHPDDEADMIYQSVRPVVNEWVVVHVALLLASPFLALAGF